MQRTLSLSVLSLSVLMFSACGGPKALTLTSPDGTKKVTVQVEIADTQEAREKGLMFRTQMPDDHGMLFVFAQPQILSFWMKDTKIPLDISFFDAQGAFVSGAQMQPCIADPCPTYNSAAQGLYALEMNKDFRQRNGIGVGWTLDVNAVKAMSNPS